MKERGISFKAALNSAVRAGLRQGKPERRIELEVLFLLIYAINQDAPDHREAKSWLEAAISGTETVGLPWIVLQPFSD